VFNFLHLLVLSRSFLLLDQEWDTLKERQIWIGWIARCGSRRMKKSGRPRNSRSVVLIRKISYRCREINSRRCSIVLRDWTDWRIFFHLAGLSSAANNSSLSRRRCTSAIVSNKCQLSQMDPRDELPHLHRSVHRGEHRVRLSGQSSSVKRRPPNGRYSSGRGKIFQVHSLGQSSRRTYRYFWRYSNFLTTQCGIGRRTKKLPNPNPLDLFR